MRIKTVAFALLLLAGAAPAALAQPPDQDRQDRQERERPARPGGESHERGDRAGGRGGGYEAPQPAPAAPQARPAPSAPEAQAPRGDRVQGGGQWQGGPPATDGRGAQAQPGRWAGGERPDAGRGASPADRADREDRQDLRDYRRFSGGRPDQGARGGRQDDHRQDDHRKDDQRRDDNRWAGNGGDRRHDGDWNRGDRNRGGWDRGNRHDRPQWRPGVYPRAFFSVQRYYARPYVRPPRFYVRVWNFGDYLPSAWFGPDYVIDDWWNFDLPPPPYGYDWVRVGDDAFLVDGYTGRIVQVVRQLFW